jgi:DNA-binding CsgD family transcriptional regulator
MQGDVRACLRQIHQLPVPTLDYLPLWLETLRRSLAADGVAALWCHASGDPAEASDATCWYAPQAPASACERLAASGWAMPPVAELQRSLSHGELLRGHARRSRGCPGALPTTFRRPPELDRCLPDGDLLDVCLLPVPRATGDAGERCERDDASVAAPIGALRLLVSRRRSRPRFSAREVTAFETAAAEFTTAPERPNFPPLTAMTPPVPNLWPEASGDIGDDVAGTLVWHRRQPEWADPAALALMHRVWRPMPGRAWPDACVVVQACQSLADELTLHPSDAVSPGVQVCKAVAVPGGTLHLHATHLCGMGGRTTERVRIALHLAVPPTLRLLQRLWGTALTPVQREIAMRLLAGQSRSQTREACAIGVQTLKTHLSLMRARLDPVRDASLLLGLGGSGATGNADRM